MSPIISVTQLDDLLETLWNLEDIHRELVQRLDHIITHLETPEALEANLQR